MQYTNIAAHWGAVVFKWSRVLSFHGLNPILSNLFHQILLLDFGTIGKRNCLERIAKWLHTGVRAHESV